MAEIQQTDIIVRFLSDLQGLQDTAILEKYLQLSKQIKAALDGVTASGKLNADQLKKIESIQAEVTKGVTPLIKDTKSLTDVQKKLVVASNEIVKVTSKVIKSEKDLTKSEIAAAKSLDRLAQTQRFYAKELERVQNQYENGKETLASYESELDQLNKIEKDLLASRKRFVTENGKLNAQQKSELANVNKLIASVGAYKGAVESEIVPLKNAQGAVKGLRNETEKLTAAESLAIKQKEKGEYAVLTKEETIELEKQQEVRRASKKGVDDSNKGLDDNDKQNKKTSKSGGILTQVINRLAGAFSIGAIINKARESLLSFQVVADKTEVVMGGVQVAFDNLSSSLITLFQFDSNSFSGFLNFFDDLNNKINVSEAGIRGLQALRDERLQFQQDEFGTPLQEAILQDVSVDTEKPAEERRAAIIKLSESRIKTKKQEIKFLEREVFLQELLFENSGKKDAKSAQRLIALVKQVKQANVEVFKIRQQSDDRVEVLDLETQIANIQASSARTLLSIEAERINSRDTILRSSQKQLETDIAIAKLRANDLNTGGETEQKQRRDLLLQIEKLEKQLLETNLQGELNNISDIAAAKEDAVNADFNNERDRILKLKIIEIQEEKDKVNKILKDRKLSADQEADYRKQLRSIEVSENDARVSLATNIIDDRVALEKKNAASIQSTRDRVLKEQQIELKGEEDTIAEILEIRAGELTLTQIETFESRLRDIRLQNNKLVLQDRINGIEDIGQAEILSIAQNFAGRREDTRLRRRENTTTQLSNVGARLGAAILPNSGASLSDIQELQTEILDLNRALIELGNDGQITEIEKLYSARVAAIYSGSRNERKIRFQEAQLDLKQELEILENRAKILPPDSIEGLQNAEQIAKVKQSIINLQAPEIRNVTDLLFPNMSEIEKSAITEFGNDVVGAIQKITAERIKAIDEDISAQKRRVNEANKIAQEGSVRSLQIEEARLDELNTKRKEYLEKQARIEKIQAQAKIIINTIQTVSALQLATANAAAVGGPLGFLTAATALSVISGLIASAANLYTPPSFFVGSDRTGRGTVDNKGGFSATIHPDEMILEKREAEKLRKMGVSKRKDIAPLVAKGLSKGGLKPIEKMPRVDRMKIPAEYMTNNINNTIDIKKLENQNKQMIAKQSEMIDAFKALRVSFNVDEKGIYGSVQNILNAKEKTNTHRSPMNK